MPVALYDLDELQAEVPLVLSRSEAETWRDQLTDLLDGPPTLTVVAGEAR